MDPPESELITAVLAGDRAAARSLYDRHAPAVYRLAHRMTRDRQLAEEFTQDTFVRAFQRLDRFRGDASLGTWLHAIAVTSVLNGLRRVRRWRGRETELEDAPGSSPGDGPWEDDLKERLRREIASLPLALRAVVVLHDLEGYSHPEIARMTGVPETTCRTRLARARAKLREALGAFV